MHMYASQLVPCNTLWIFRDSLFQSVSAVPVPICLRLVGVICLFFFFFSSGQPLFPIFIYLFFSCSWALSLLPVLSWALSLLPVLMCSFPIFAMCSSDPECILYSLQKHLPAPGMNMLHRLPQLLCALRFMEDIPVGDYTKSPYFFWL